MQEVQKKDNKHTQVQDFFLCEPWDGLFRPVSGQCGLWANAS